MPAVSFNGEVRDGKNCLRYLENNFDRLLMYKTQVGLKKKKKKYIYIYKNEKSRGEKKGLSALKPMAA